jgi:TldD protein
MSLTRRDFLAVTSAGVLGLTKAANAIPLRTAGGHAANVFVPPMAEPSQLSRLASRALEAATAAGAQYADVRVANRQELSVFLDASWTPLAIVESSVGYGVRVMVNGTMAFSYGSTFTPDGVANVARNAVAQARGLSKLPTARIEMAPAPAVTGMWSSPYQIDPFAVPLMEQADTLGAWMSITRRRPNAWSQGQFRWERETRVCATTEGTSVTQTFLRALPEVSVNADWLGPDIDLQYPPLGSVLAGYEHVAGNTVQTGLEAATEEALRYAQLPVVRMDVGRYPIVVDGTGMATAMITTVGAALELDRVLGFESNASGGSFLGPTQAVLGQSLFSPLLSVSTNRSSNSVCGAKWDDEGVVAEPVTIVAQGRVVDYLTSRYTAPALREWYASQGMPYRSHGYARVKFAHQPVLVGPGDTTVAPGTEQVGVEDLYRSISHGLYLVRPRNVYIDQQRASGRFHGGVVLEIRNGKIVNRVRGIGLQFKTVDFWKNIAALGDATTVRSTSHFGAKGLPWQDFTLAGSAPAAKITSINVTQEG